MIPILSRQLLTMYISLVEIDNKKYIRLNRTVINTLNSTVLLCTLRKYAYPRIFTISLIRSYAFETSVLLSFSQFLQELSFNSTVEVKLKLCKRGWVWWGFTLSSRWSGPSRRLSWGWSRRAGPPCCPSPTAPWRRSRSTGRWWSRLAGFQFQILKKN